MLSLEDFAAIQLSAKLCDELELKREIFCAPGSAYDKNKNVGGFTDPCYRKCGWNAIIKSKVKAMLNNLSSVLKEKVISNVLSVGRRMLIWAEYHEGTIGVSREFSIEFFNSSFFTSKGIIDNARAAIKLLHVENLRITQQFKLACIYCFKDHIYDCYSKMTFTEKRIFYHDRHPREIRQPNFVKMWSYYVERQVGMLKEEEKSLDQSRLEMAIESGSIAAVKWCLVETNFKSKANALVDAAVETLRRISYDSRNDWIVFEDRRFNDREISWTPSDWYVDIFCFLFSRMTEDQRRDVFNRDIEGAHYELAAINPIRPRILEYFLDSPYQHHFMTTVELMWNILPERSYARLLLLICDKIDPKKGSINYGEEKSLNYRKLFKKFWRQSPEHYKRYVLIDKEVTDGDGVSKLLKEGKLLLARLFAMKHFTNEDEENVKVILNSATAEEKTYIIYSEDCKNICFELMKGKNWKLLNIFVSLLLSDTEQAVQFKRKLSFMEESRHICILFIIKGEWEAAESFISWSTLPQNEIIRLKTEMISSDCGKHACREMFLHNAVEIANRFCDWCLSSEEKIKAFKKELGVL